MPKYKVPILINSGKNSHFKPCIFNCNLKPNSNKCRQLVKNIINQQDTAELLHFGYELLVVSGALNHKESAVNIGRVTKEGMESELDRLAEEYKDWLDMLYEKARKLNAWMANDEAK